jgi:hypothetical protein
MSAAARAKISVAAKRRWGQSESRSKESRELGNFESTDKAARESPS